MSFRTDLLVTVEKLRRLPQFGFDIRTFSITVVTRTWSGGKVRVGTPTDSFLRLIPRPKVKEQENGDTIIVSPITPKNKAGGYTPNQLRPADVQGVEFWWQIEGPFSSGVTSARYIPVHIDTARAFKYTVICKLLERGKPI